ncbi:MAG TPA: Pycsar system effector family protein [Saprospiraceae bacterium]|nr:Pycsar system effector family protein [Saprospiraceae bacterium]
MELSREIVDKVKSYVEDFFEKSMPEIYCFHNLEHTRQVVISSLLLAQKAGLSESEQLKLEIASWLHDTGYNSGPEGHEERSATLARTVLSSYQINQPLIDEISKIILSTKMPQLPNNQLEMIICDADLSHLGNEHFWERNELIRKEMSNLGSKMQDEAWILFELAFIKAHTYHTPEAKSLFDTNKEEYCKILEDQLLGLKGNANAKDKKKDEKKKLKKLSRGAETLYKTAYQTHLNLNSLADSKAHIMLSVNSILLSASFSFLIPKWGNDTRLIIPSLVLIITALLAILFAILTIKPKLITGNISKDDVKTKTADLLFFGNYTTMSLTDYKWGMRELIKDPEYTYNSLSQTLYFLGQVLKKKYKYLIYCYLVFINGLVLSVILFGVCMLLIAK